MSRQKVDQAREQALKILRRTEKYFSFPKLLLDQTVATSPSLERERAFVYQLVAGTLRYRGTIDWALERLSATSLDNFTAWIRNILRLGLFQILFLDKVPKSAAVDESVKLAKKYGHAGTAGLVNAVLRNARKQAIFEALSKLDTETIPNMAVKYSHPPWLVELLVQEWGKEHAIEIMAQNNLIPPLTARVNTLRTSREMLLERLYNEGASARPLDHTDEGIEFQNVSAPWKLESHKEGLFYLQDASSMLAVHCLEAMPGQQILDVCAGPGGKATHLAALMNNTGKIYALDIHDHKLALIQENTRRLGVAIIEARKEDATACIAEIYPDMDRVIVDAPCSGLGVTRRRIDLKWRLRAGQIEELSRLQAQILHQAAKCVRASGILLYCTCTITKRENDAVVRRFLHDHDDFRQDTTVPYRLKRYLTDEGFIRIMPGDENMDGFFIARLKRI